MIFIAKYENDNTVIAFSEDRNAMFQYLTDFYTKSYEKGIKIHINTIEGEDAENDVIMKYYEYELTSFWGIYVTQWECSILYEMILNHFNNISNTIKDMAYHRLLQINDKSPTHEELDQYLRESLGDKYGAYANFDRFMNELGKEGIKSFMIGTKIYREMYLMNKEFERKISEDN